MTSLFHRTRSVPADHPAFRALPVEHIVMRDGRTRLAVHRRGRFAPGRVPLVCVPGYNRNMSDFSALAEYFPRLGSGDWPLRLLDLAGRGRAADR